MERYVFRSAFETSTCERAGRKSGVKGWRNQADMSSVIATDTLTGALNSLLDCPKLDQYSQAFICPSNHLSNVGHSRKGNDLG